MPKDTRIEDVQDRERLAELTAAAPPDLRELSNALQRDYHRFANRNYRLITENSKVVMGVLLLLVAINLAVGGLSIYLLDQNGQRAGEIQAERRNAYLVSCQDQNARHDATVNSLGVLISQIRDPVRRRRAEASKVGTILLINALAPHQDCKARVKMFVSGG